MNNMNYRLYADIFSPFGPLFTRDRKIIDVEYEDLSDELLINNLEDEDIAKQTEEIPLHEAEE